MNDDEAAVFHGRLAPIVISKCASDSNVLDILPENDLLKSSIVTVLQSEGVSGMLNIDEDTSVIDDMVVKNSFFFLLLKVILVSCQI